MNWIDVFLSVIIIICALNGLRKGLIFSLIIFCSWIVIIYLVLTITPFLQNFFTEIIKFPQLVALIFSILLIVIAVMLTARLIITLSQKLLNLLYLGWLDKLGGLILGFLTCIITIVIILIFIELFFDFSKFRTQTSDSILLGYLINIKDLLLYQVSNLPEKLASEINII